MKTIDMGRGVRLSTPILSADEAAAYLGVSPRSFRRLDVPGHMVAGAKKYDSREIDEWVKIKGDSAKVDG
jgi:hypothetical protein